MLTEDRVICDYDGGEIAVAILLGCLSDKAWVPSRRELLTAAAT